MDQFLGGRPNGVTSQVAFSDKGLPTSFNDGSGEARQSFDPYGRRTSLAFPNGVKTSCVYNTRGLVSQVKTSYPDDSVLNEDNYAYTSTGKISAVSDSMTGTTAYSYDKRGELAAYTDSLHRTVTYSYDASGNRTAKTIGIDYRGPYDQGKKLGIDEIVQSVIDRTGYKGNKTGIRRNIIEVLEYLLNDKPLIHGDKQGLQKTVLEIIDGSVWRFTYSYNGADELTSYFDPITSQSYTFTYDRQGNMTAKEDYLGITHYKWNSKNRLIEADLPDGTIITYSYSPAGTRLTKSVNGSLTRYGYDGIKLQWQATTQPDGSTLTYSFTYTPAGEPYAMHRGTASYFYHQNAHGDVLFMTDDSGHDVASYSYGPWGNVESAKGTLAEQNPIRYAGYLFDSDTGLYYLINRYYDPSLGRFISRDPMRQAETDLVNMNQYLYCGNEPVGCTDCDGNTTYTKTTSWKHYYKKQLWDFYVRLQGKFSNKGDEKQIVGARYEYRVASIIPSCILYTYTHAVYRKVYATIPPTYATFDLEYSSIPAWTSSNRWSAWKTIMKYKKPYGLGYKTYLELEAIDGLWPGDMYYGYWVIPLYR